VLDRVREALVNVLGEGLTRVVGQDAYDHDSIILYMRAGIVLLGEELANLCGRRCCSAWTCDGGFDDSGEVEHFFALLQCYYISQI
jgi:hypothetical protein